MANFNISDLPLEATSINDTDVFEVEQGGINKFVQGSTLKAYIGIGAGLPILKGNYDISVNTFPPSALYGYMYFTGATNSTSLLAHDGGPIQKGSLLIANKVSGAASTTLNSDWIIIQTQY